MRLVLDTNILMAALIKDSLTRKILLSPQFEFLLPEFALEEIDRHRGKIARHSQLRPEEIQVLIGVLVEAVTVVPMDRVVPHLAVAEELIGARDPTDVPFVALALAEQNEGIWSNDRAFEGLPGIQLWRTADLKAYLKRAVRDA
jgi:predicted nucleic acid-binding protein